MVTAQDMTKRKKAFSSLEIRIPNRQSPRFLTGPVRRNFSNGAGFSPSEVDTSGEHSRKSGLFLTGFTLVELLVVIAVIALLMGILMPALARVRQIAFRMTCGANLSGIGKAMVTYANDYRDEFPRSGGRNSAWDPAIPDWKAPHPRIAFGLDASYSGGAASISSCFYLLVKYAEVTPKSFVCKGDSGTTEFKLSEFAADVPADADCAPADAELIDVWDFGPYRPDHQPTMHCSYSYHIPFNRDRFSGLYDLTTRSEPGMAVVADRNPWIKSPAADAKDFSLFMPDLPPQYKGSAEQGKHGNAIAHQEDGQNVLFVDSHVVFEKRPFCGIENDNIYTVHHPPGPYPVLKGDARGWPARRRRSTKPGCPRDSICVHDGLE